MFFPSLFIFINALVNFYSILFNNTCFLFQILAFAALVTLAIAAPQNPNADVQVVRYENENIGVDGYKFAYETSDGTSRQEEGTLKNAGSENEALAVTGSFTWKDPQSGKVYTVTFTADENGYKPTVTGA